MKVNQNSGFQKCSNYFVFVRNIRIILCSFIEFELSKKLFDTFKMTLSGATTNQLFLITVTV